MKNNKKKLIKNLLATTSLCAMIITGGASSALGAAGDERVTDGNYLLETGDNIKDVGGGGPTPSPFLNQEKLKFGGDHSGSTGTFADTIDYIETNGKNPGAFTINGTAITITSVTGGGNGLPIVMENGSQLTLSGVNYDALASIEAANLGNGILHLTGNGLVYNGTIGKTLRLAEINVNAGGKAVTLGGAVKATTININAKDTLTLNGATNADVINFTDEGTITLNENLGGASGADAAVKFAADGTLAVTGNRTITGTIDNTSGADGVGTLTFNNQGRVTGLIGNTNALELVKLDGANTKDVTFDSLVKAQELQLTGGGDAILSKGATIDKLTISNADSYVQIGNTQTLEFTGNTTPIDLTGNNGHIRFGDANSVLKFNTVAAADVTINLDGDLDPGAVGKGIIKFDASNANIIVNNVNGAATQSLGIAGGNILKEIEISSGANKSVTLNTIINTDKLKINASANVKYDPKGDVDLRKITFGDANSSLTLIASGAADCKFTLQEDVNPGGADQGIVMLDGSAKKLTLDANAAGKTLGHTNKLNKVVAKGDVKITNLVTVNATNFNVLTGTADVKNASVLGSNITIGTAAVPAVLGAAAVAAIPATLAIDSNHQAGPININDNGTTIKFEDANSTLKLTNNTVANGAGADTIFTLKGNLISNSTAAPAAYTNGQLVIEATAAKLKITPDAAEKIGDDADKRFKKVTVSGNQEITLTPQIFTETFEVINKANVIVSNASVLNSNITIGTPAVPAGAAAIPATLAIDSNQVAAIDIRSTPAGNGAAARTITFEHEDSILKLTNNNANGVGVATIFTLKENLISDATATVVAAGKYTHGHLVIEATAEKLTIEPAVVGGVAKTIGDDADKRFKKVTVSGNKEITLTPQIFTETFEVINGANVIVSNASVLDSNITIGATNGVAVGAATLAIDSNRQAGPIDIMPTLGGAPAARTIQFEHEDSILKLTNNTVANGAGVNTIFTLNENLITKDHGLAVVAANYTRGHLVIEATAKQLTIEPAVVVGVGVAKTIGESADKRFKKITVSGNKEITLTPQIFTETFEVIKAANVIVSNASVLDSNITIGATNGVAVGAATLAIDSNRQAGPIDIMPTPAGNGAAARTIQFEHEDSILKLTNNNNANGGGVATIFTLNENLITKDYGLAAANYTRGHLVIEATAKQLTIEPAVVVGVAKTIGESADKRFKKVTISGNGEEESLANKIILLPTIFTETFEVIYGAIVEVPDASVLNSNITIGTPAVPAVPGGAAAVAAIPATLAIDSNLAPAIDIRPTPAVAPAARTITFEHEDSTLKLTNNNAGGGGGGAPTTFKLKQNLISDATATVVVAGKYTHGKLVIEAKEAKLTITPNGVGAAETIGESVDKRFKKVTISGNKDITITPKIFSKEIEISSTGAIELGAIELGDVSVVGDSKLKFTTDSNNAVKFTDHVTVHTIDFNDKVRNITVDNNKKITTQKIVKGDKAKITFAGNGELKLSNGADTAVFEQIIAGAAGSEVKLSAGSYTGEIQFSDTGKITAANQFVLNGGFNTTGGAAGVIEFEGTSTITGDLGSASRLGAVTVKGGGELIVCGNVNVATLDGVAGTEKLTFNNRAKIEVNGDIGGLQQFALITLGGGEVDFKGAVNTVAFSFATDSTIGSDLGATNIVAGGGNRILTVTADQNITGDIGDFGTLHVDGDKTITLNTAKFEAAITTKTDGQGTINVLRGGNDVKIKSIGTVGEKFKEVNIGAEITAGTAGAGVYTQALNINANAEALLTDVNADNITVNDDGQVVFLGDLISANPIKFTHADSAAGFFDMDINNALISDGGARRGNIGIYGSKLKANIGTNAAPVKAVEFNDNYNGVATAKKSEIDANIYAEDIVVRRDYKLKLQKDVEFGGKTTIDQAIITLGEHDLTLKGGASSITTSTIKTTVNRGNVGNFVAGAGANVTLNGEITVDVNVTAMPADKARVFLIKKDPTGTINKAGANFKIVKSAGAFADWTVENNDEGLALVFQDNTAEVISSDLASIGASSPTSSENSQAIEDAIDGTDGEAIQSLFNSFSDSSERADAIVRLFDNLSDNASEVSTENVSIAIDSVSSRISDNFVVPIAIDSSAFNFVPDTTSTIGTPDIGSSTPSSSLPPQIVDSAGNATPTGNVAPTGNTTSTGSATQTGGTNASKPAATTPQKATTGTKTNTTGPNDGKARAQRKVSSEEIIYGLSAGDDPTRYGVWMAPFAGNGVKKKNKTASGYKSTSVGGTFGFDTKVNDNLVLGLAVTALNSRVNHKDFKKGDKTKIDTTLFSAYASIDMGSNWYSQNIASIGSSRVENKENRRVSRASYGIANGKYSTMHFALESTTGFNKLINNQVVLTPSFGLGYSRVNDTSYTETGNVGAQALTITKKASQKLELIGGLRLTALPFMVNEMYVTPEVHASVRHDVIGKNPTTFSKVNGLRDLKEKSKPTKTYYGVGGGLKFSYNMMDYGVYADTTYAKKYVGVNGSVNVRVNF